MLNDVIQKIAISYPFVDLLGDGYSSFVYSKYLPVTATNVVAQAGTVAYGTIPIPSEFDPRDEAYAFNSSTKEIYLNAHLPLDKEPIVTTSFTSTAKIGPWPLNLYVLFNVNSLFLC